MREIKKLMQDKAAELLASGGRSVRKSSMTNSVLPIYVNI